MSDAEVKRILAILGLMAIAGCGGDASLGDRPGGGGGMLTLRLDGAKAFDPSIAAARIEGWGVRIEGEGIEDAIVALFPGDAAEGVIEDVPEGRGRRISVEAFNVNGAVVRAGEAAGVAVEGMTDVAIQLESVPVFVNVADGGAVDNTRLVLRLLSDPAHMVAVEDSGGRPVADADTNADIVSLDAATGLGRLAPRLLPPGPHTFVARDLANGRTARVDVNLLDGTKRRGAPLASAVGAGPTRIKSW